MGSVPNTATPGIVGREQPLAQLAGVLGRAANGHRSVALIAGESGIGKTELVRASTAGCPLVAWGTCVEDAAAGALWPWTRVFDQLTRAIGLRRARQLAGIDAALLGAVIPALGVADDHDATARERLVLLDAASRWLDSLTALGTAVVVVLDDLQWADESTLALLELVARSPQPCALALLGCYRPAELNQRGEHVVRSLATTAEHIELGGVDADAAHAIVRAVAAPAAADSDEIHRRAGGHPVFIRELALTWARGDHGAIPNAVRDAIADRIHRLPAETQTVLRAAALVGNDVPLDVVAGVVGGAPTDLAPALSPAFAAAILTGSTTTPSFAHDLYRETLVALIDEHDRLRMHQLIGAAMEARHERGGDVDPADVARHLVAAIGLDGPERAATWARTAARRDIASFAFTEAAAHLRRWRQAVADSAVAVDDELRIDMLVAEADPLARAGALVDARGLLRSAHQLALRIDRPDLLATIALAVAGLGAKFAARRDDVIRELDAALVAIAGRSPALEARVAATLARELQHSVADDRPRAEPLSQHALELGRAAGEPSALLACLIARHDVLWTPGQAAARAELANEIIATAQQCGDDEHRAEGLLLLANALLEQGSSAFRPAIDECLALLDALGQPRHRYVAATRRAALALLDGDLTAAEALIDEAAALGARIREPDTENVRMSQRLELVRARNDPDELTAFAGAAIAHWQGAPVHAQAVAAGFLARAGAVDAARQHVSTVVDLGTWRVDRSYLWSVFVRELTDAAIALGDDAVASQLLADLLPLTECCGVNGAVVAFAGSHAQTAARLTAALGGDPAPLLARARATYERLGAPTWSSALDALAPATTRSAARALRRRGRVWDVEFDGHHAEVPHSKGLDDLATLLARPSRDVHVLDLYDPPDRGGAAGDVLDRRALVAYRDRIRELDVDIAEADAKHDGERAARATAERDAVLDELRRATRPDGRSQPFANHPAERARKAVAARVRDAIRKLAPVAPELAAHLDQTIVTGTCCRYRGDPTPAWHIERG